MTNPASELAKFRKQVDGHCLQCGVSFTGLKTKRYCSNACRQKTKYQRKKKDGSS